MFSRFFIDRPIFASVLSIVITLAGFIVAWTLPVTQYPEITPPTVEVSAVYSGANAQVVADTVAAPIEQQVNGVEGMLYMSSQCTNDGMYALTVAFRPGADLNLAQVLVQNRVALAQPVLPALVQRVEQSGDASPDALPRLLRQLPQGAPQRGEREHRRDRPHRVRDGVGDHVEVEPEQLGEDG